MMRLSNMKLVIFMVVILHQTCMSQAAGIVVIQKPNVTGPYQGEVSLYCNYIFEDVPEESIHLIWWRGEKENYISFCASEDSHGSNQKEDLNDKNSIEFNCLGTNFGITLVLKNLTLKDAGLYFCEVWSEGSTEHAWGSVNLSVVAKPSNMDLTSTEANSFSFQSSGWFPRPSVHWTDERNQDWTHSAVINIIKGKDGLYNIQTVLQTNRTLHRAKLHLSYINPYTGEEQTDVLQEKPILFCPAPTLHVFIPIQNVTGPYHGQVSLYCSSSTDNVAIESIHFKWWRNETENHTICASGNGYRQKQEEDRDYRNATKSNCFLKDRTFILVLKNLTLKDAGVYICEVWSEGPSLHAQDSVNLSVAAKPSDMDLTSMEANSLSFQSSGWFPRPSVHWTDEKNQDWTHSAVTNITNRNDDLYNIQTVLHTNRTLHTAKLHLSYINPYTGEEQTDFLQREAVPLYPLPALYVFIPIQNVTGPYHGEVSLFCSCSTENVPLERIHFKWWRNETGNHTICASENDYRQKKEEGQDYRNGIKPHCFLKGHTFILVLKNLTPKDAGVYICEAWSEGSSLHVQDSVNLSVAVQTLSVWIIVGSCTGIFVGAFIAIAATKCQHKISSGGEHKGYEPLEGADESFSAEGSTTPRLQKSSSYGSFDGARPPM